MQHIGFIMDGNRTWAKNRWIPQFEGHRQGYENAKTIIELCAQKQIPYISFWALSDDNIRSRSPEEVAYLFWLLEKWVVNLGKLAKKNNYRFFCVWDRTLLSKKCQENIEKSEKITENCTGMQIIFAIGYGWQEEIARAVQKYAKSNLSLENITAKDILNNLETWRFPPPDLIIRTGGHIRHSGYFLFQSPYAEYFFSEKNWPDFDAPELEHAIIDFQDRIRKFGK